MATASASRSKTRTRAACSVTPIATRRTSKRPPMMIDSPSANPKLIMWPLRISPQLRRRADILRVPTRVQRVAHPNEIQQLAGDEVDDLGDRGRVEVEAGVGGAEEDAGVAQRLVVVDVDRRQRHLAVDEDEAAALLE